MGTTYNDYLAWLSQQERMAQSQSQGYMQPILSYVANRTAADLFNVNFGQSAILVDMDAPFVYRKARGTDGKLLPLEIYDLVKHEEQPPAPTVSLEGYVKYEDIDRIVAKEVEKRITEAFKPSRKKAED